jgi:tetratricopeptide (TPR) repeat protein
MFGEGQMGEGQMWALADPLVSLLDFRNYTLKDWLQLLVAVFGIVGSVVGAWKWWRYSKWQIVNRLFEYLNADEKNVTEGRRIVLDYLRGSGRGGLKSDVEFHATIDKAIKLLEANRMVEAEAVLNAFALMLKGSAEVGRRHSAVASEQASTILLFVALIAKQRADVTAARDALMDALDQCPDDAEVVRSLGELDLDVDPDKAQVRFDQALRLAAGDSLLQGEIWMLKAKAYERDSSPATQAQRSALLTAASLFATAGADGKAAAAYSRAGDIERARGFTRRARQSFINALRCYDRLNDAQGVADTRDKLKALGADLNGLPDIARSLSRRMPWFWIRLALELSILGLFAYLAFMSR